MAKFNFCKHGLTLLVLTLFIGDAYSVPSETPAKDVDDDKITLAIKELETPKECLTDGTINCFIDLVNENYKGTFEMADVLLYQVPEFYKNFAKNDTDDVQILYGGEINDPRDDTPEEFQIVGHYICVFYKHTEQRVYVYDSFFLKKLTDIQQQIVKNVYPSAKYMRYVKPKKLQKDTSSCGAFSIAYATTLILGENPKSKLFTLDKTTDDGDQSMTLREHIKQMLISKTLTPFPAK